MNGNRIMVLGAVEKFFFQFTNCELVSDSFFFLRLGVYFGNFFFYAIYLLSGFAFVQFIQSKY